METNATMEVLNCLNDNEQKELDDLMKKAGLTKVDSESENTTKYSGKIRYGYNHEVEEWLKNNGVPFKRWSGGYDDFSPIMVIFDGIREHDTPADGSGNALVDMRAIEAIKEMLEDDQEIRALVYANQHWINNDISSMWRWGMEETIKVGNTSIEDAEIIEKE